LQDAKTSIGERLQANNGTFSEHNDITDQDNIGRHKQSEIGFASTGSLPDPTVPGALHYDPSAGLYVCNEDASGWVRLTWNMDHGSLEDLSADDHTQYLRVDGSRAMTGTLDLGANGELSEYSPGSAEEDDSPLLDDHDTDNYYQGHGADSVLERHITGTINTSELNDNFVEQGVQGSDRYTYESGDVGNQRYVGVSLSLDMTGTRARFTPVFSVESWLNIKGGEASEEGTFDDLINAADYRPHILWDDGAVKSGLYIGLKSGGRGKAEPREWEDIGVNDANLIMDMEFTLYGTSRGLEDESLAR
jgi:hypothetical protein